MGDEWDDGVATENDSYGGNNYVESVGKSFGKGRGFTPQGVEDNNFGDGGSWNSGGGGGGGRDFGERRGRGGRGGPRGGRGGRGGGGRFGDSDDNNDSWNKKSNDDGWSNSDHNNGDDFGGRSDDRGERRGRGGGRGRGGRGGGRDRDNFGGSEDKDGFGGGDGDGDGEGEEKQKVPVYVPRDLTEDEIFEDTGITRGINFDQYDDIPVKVTGENAPPAIESFRQAGLRDVLLTNLSRSRYDKPTPIQKHALPVIINKRDLMATAQTGSGKTAAFLLPIIHCLLNDHDEYESGGSMCQPSVLVVSPTRELTIQIYEVARKFTTSSYLKTCRIYGGAASFHQSRQLSNGCHILIATPGRLEDFVNRGYVGFSMIKFVVLDEADRMLDMGFRDTIEKIMSHPTMSPANSRQTLMFSATFSQDIQRLAAKYLRDYIFVAVGIVGGACKDVEQNFIAVSRNEKKKAVKTLLDEQQSVEGTLLFVEQKRTADFIASFLCQQGFKTTSIHGDRFQSQREEALADFKAQRMAILVATSVAARGLDIKGVKHVINYDLPSNIEDYVHRIGRTGRLGNRGKATSFYDSNDNRSLATDLVRILEQAGQPVPPFLKEDAGGPGEYEDSAFGGYDYRKGDEGGFKTDSHNQPQQIQEEESW